jgi:hypothetical protein
LEDAIEMNLSEWFVRDGVDVLRWRGIQKRKNGSKGIQVFNAMMDGNE